MSLQIIFWVCFIGGCLFTLLFLVIGELIDGLVDGIFGSSIFYPGVIIGSVTIFGGIGLILLQLSPFSTTYILPSAISAGVASLFLLYYLYVKPVKMSENSTSFQMTDLIGQTGEVTVTIPADGFGEVMIFTLSGYTNQIAQSENHQAIKEGTKVIITGVTDSILIVSAQLGGKE